jgi:type I restriction enzyme S subunit
MGLKIFTIDFKSIGSQEFLRLDVGYRYFFDIQNAIVYKFNNLVKLKYILKLLPTEKVSKGYLDDEEYLIDIGNIERRFNNLINLEKVSEVGSDKNILQDGDIVIPKMQPQMGNIFLNTEHKRFLGSTELLEYSISEKYNHLFVYYLITSNKFLSDLAKLESGKTHRRVNPIDLLKIKIPLIPKSQQDQIVAQIEPIEKKIKELKANIRAPHEIINEVFAREFGFDLEKFEEAKRKKFFEVDFSKISKNNLTRFSSHFHHIKLNFLENKIKDKDYWIPLNNKFRLSGGKRIPKGKTFSNEPTDYYYLRPSEINIWGVDKNNLLYISKEIYNELKRYNIKTGEFCISIVGTLGKTALINTEELDIEENNLILSENFIKLKPIKDINSYFYYYFFYSFIFQAQIDREYTITSIKKLGIDKWNYIKIPNIPLSEQQKIVDEIKAELDKQEEIKKQIEEERNKIDEIIEKAIK